VGTPLSLGGSLREDQAPAPAVHLDHFDREFPANEVGQVAAVLLALAPGPKAGDLGGWDKALYAAKAADDASLVVAGDGDVDDLAALHQLLCPNPVRVCAGQVDRHDETVLAIIGADHVDVNLLAGLELGELLRIHALQVSARDEGISLGPDVDQHLIRADAEDLPLADVASHGMHIVVLARHAGP